MISAITQVSLYIPTLSSAFFTSTWHTHSQYLPRFLTISMAFYCLRIWVLAACWIVFFHCQNRYGFNASASEFANISINGDAAIAETDSDFICATLDWWPPDKCDYGTCSWGKASILNLDLESSLLENAVKAFDPLKIRLGGSLEDRVIYDVGDLKQPCHPFVKNDSLAFNFTDGCLPMSRWDALNLFFKKTRAVVAFGLNAVNGRKEISKGVWEGPWDSTNAYDLIQYTVDHGYQIKAWELGNELSGRRISNTTQYAADAINLHGILKKIYKNFQAKPLLVAPDGAFNATWYTEFIQKSGPNIVDVVTHHIYNLGPGVDEHLVEKILDPSYLSQEESIFKSLKTILENYGPWSRAWVGEAGGAYNSGHNLVTNAFVSSFWYLDQLGMASTYNTKSYCKQSLIGGNYGFLNTTTYVPNPDYYSALLWHQLMGERVLSVSSNGTQYLRTYAHCTKNATGVTLLLINLGKLDGVTVEISIYSQNGGQKNLNARTDFVNGKSRLEYHLTAKDGDLHSQTMLLNGKLLDVSPKGEIPSLEPVEVNLQTPISVAPLSIAFVSLPYVELLACSR